MGTLPRAGSSGNAAVTVGQSSSAESAEDLCVCGHPQAQHDAVAARYCGATIAGSMTRRCVCPGRVDDH